MLLYDLYYFLKIIVWVLVVVQPVGKLFKCLEEAVKIHLIIVTPADYVLVNYIVMSFQYVVVRKSWVLREPLEL